MNIKHFIVTSEHILNKAEREAWAANGKSPIIERVIVEAPNRCEAMDKYVDREHTLQAELAAGGDLSGAIEKRRVRISASIVYQLSAVGYETREKREAKRAERKAERAAKKASRAERKAKAKAAPSEAKAKPSEAERKAKAKRKAEAEAEAARFIAKDGRAAAVPDGAKSTRKAKARPSKAA